jgi:anti-anti-sigma regulatory factor
MMRITTETVRDTTTFKLEGKLIGAWVEELERSWKEVMAANPHQLLRLDLTEVTFIDARAKTLLSAMYRAGTELTASGVFMKRVVRELTAVSRGHRQRLQGEK